MPITSFYNETTFVEGFTIISIEGLEMGSSEVFIHTSGGTIHMLHHQDCCENVSVEDITGDIEDLIGATILLFEERNGETPADHKWEWCEPESYTWTFYEIQTSKGDVQIRWLGTSNGYYSESVDVQWIPNKKSRCS